MSFFNSTASVAAARQYLGHILLSSQLGLWASQKWEYPSDHISRFARVNNLRIGILNTLNQDFISHLHPVPGWRDSSLVEKSKTTSSRFPGLNEREAEVCEILLFVLREKPSADAMCLQECSGRVHYLLKSVFEPLKIGVIAGNGKGNNHVVTLVDEEKYKVVNVASKAVFNRFIRERNGWVIDNRRPVLDVLIEEKSHPCGIAQKIQIINLHSPSAGQNDYYKMDRIEEVRKYVEELDQKRNPAILCGDYNASEALASQVFASEQYKVLPSEYSQIENIVGPDGVVHPPHLVGIDHFTVRFPDGARANIGLENIPLSQTSDEKSAWTQTHIFQPIINDPTLRSL